MYKLFFRLNFLLFVVLISCKSSNKSIHIPNSTNQDFVFEVVINDANFKKWLSSQTSLQNIEVPNLRPELLKKLSNYNIWVKQHLEQQQNINYLESKTYSQEVDTLVYQYLIYFEEKHNITL